MSKQAIFFASTVTGLGLLGAVVFMQVNPRAFTSAPRVDLDSYLYSEVRAMPVTPPPTPAVIAEPQPDVMVLPPVEVFARPRAPASTPAVVHEPSVPCSPWREVAPRHVDDGQPSGSVSVRDLC
jgi:hypothetical protein